MKKDNSNHECDLFLMSSHRPYIAERILPQFAIRGNRNIHGWGIGTYANGNANVIRSSDPVFKISDGRGRLNREFAMAVEAISSPTILGHLRLTSRGSVQPQNNHPFKLNFMGYDWLLIHNGSVSRSITLVPHSEYLLPESNNDTPRIFEFMRSEIIKYYFADPKKSLIEACRSAFSKLLDKDQEGTFNLILSNGYLNFGFIHWRPFYLLSRAKTTGDTTFLSTLKLTDDEEWVKIEKLPQKKAKMLVFSGHSLLFNGDIPK